MLDEKYLNATKAAEFLGCSREWFYTLKEKYELKPAGKYSNMYLYHIKHLKRVKKAMQNG